MVSIYTVDVNALIAKVAQELKKSDLVQPTDWAKFVKTGVSKQRPPVDEDWWYVRAASILRSVYKLGPVGVSKLRTKYGGKQNRGVRPEKFKDASGNIIRTILQQLEKEGLVAQAKDKRKGRVITPKGQSLLEKSASVLLKETKSDKKDDSKEVKKHEKSEKSEKPHSKSHSKSEKSHEDKAPQEDVEEVAEEVVEESVEKPEDLSDDKIEKSEKSEKVEQ